VEPDRARLFVRVGAVLFDTCLAVLGPAVVTRRTSHPEAEPQDQAEKEVDAPRLKPHFHREAKVISAIQEAMGQQHNKNEKRRRRTSYLRRKKDNAKTAAARKKS
jgi:hypothetical protein